MRMIHIIIAICLLSLKSSFPLFAVGIKNTLHLPKQEKLYLHTDKPYYLIGDTIWFKGYLVDMQSHRMQDAESRFIYVELIDRKNKVRYRKKIKRDDYGFSNYMAITPEFIEGDYQLRAYTNYMRNEGEDFFFTKPITIYNSTASIMFVNYRLETDEKKRQYAVISFTKNNGKPYVGKYVDCMIRTKEYNNRFKRRRTDKNGELRLLIPLKQELPQYMDLTLLDGELSLHKKIYLPDKYDYSVGFYPEGGHLLAGVEQVVAFKAESTTGVSPQITGYVLNQRKDTLARFRSEHEGIGSFVIKAESGDSLTAFTQDGIGIWKAFPLCAEKNKVALSITQNERFISYRLLCPNHTKLEEDLELLVHVRGKMIYRKSLTAFHIQDSILKKDIPEGIVHFTVFNEKEEALSERLAFVCKDEVFFQLPARGTSSTQRSVISLGIKLLDKEFKPLRGQFSMSVTDDYIGAPNDIAGNIRTNLLLTSDLKGKILSPGYYFEDMDENRIRHLDQLMMTQGWKRFSTEALLRNEHPVLQWQPEIQQTVRGKAEKFLGGKFKNKNIIVLVPKFNKTRVFPIKDDGRFEFTHDFPDYTGFAMALKSGRAWSALEQIEQSFPDAHLDWPSENVNKPSEMPEQLADIHSGYVMIDGEKVYQMPELTVQGASPYSAIAYKSINTELLEEVDADNALELLNQMPEICIYWVTSSNESRIPSATMDPRGAEVSKIDTRYSTQAPSTVRDIRTGELRIGLNNHLLHETGVLNAGSFLDPTLPFAKSNQCVFARVYVDGTYIKDTRNLVDLKAKDIQFIDYTDREVNNLKELDMMSWEFEDAWSNVERDNRNRRFHSIRITTFPDKRGRFVENDGKILKAVPLGYAANATFYAPQYPTPESRDRSIPDNRTTIHWEPNITLNENGEAAVSFYTADRPSTYTVVIEGVTTDGRVCRYVKKIK